MNGSYQRRCYSSKRSPSPPKIKEQYSVSPNLKGSLSAALVSSIILIPFSIKIPSLSVFCILSIIATIYLYLEVDKDAESKALIMKDNMSIEQIKSALRTPPSPQFDDIVRDKVKRMIN